MKKIDWFVLFSMAVALVSNYFFGSTHGLVALSTMMLCLVAYYWYLEQDTSFIWR